MGKGKEWRVLGGRQGIKQARRHQAAVQCLLFIGGFFALEQDVHLNYHQNCFGRHEKVDMMMVARGLVLCYCSPWEKCRAIQVLAVVLTSPHLCWSSNQSPAISLQPSSSSGPCSCNRADYCMLNKPPNYYFGLYHTGPMVKYKIENGPHFGHCVVAVAVLTAFRSGHMPFRRKTVKM